MIYFDSAATTLQKPSAVAAAMGRAVREMASPGRGGHRASMLAAETAYRCRAAAAELFGAPEPDSIVFTYNATHALNMAIKSCVSAGDGVVISGYEHNSVVRPLAAAGARITVASSPPWSQGAALAAFDAAIKPHTKLVVCNHVSNVFGCILPVEEIAALCTARGVPFLLDASQSAGLLPIHAERLGADFIAMPGHKGLYGPQGTGVLISKTVPASTLLEGGTGSDSLLTEMPGYLPDRLEAGTHNMPGISGLLAGIRFVERKGSAAILRHERGLAQLLTEGLRRMPDVQVYAGEPWDDQAGVVSFRVRDRDCEAVAGALAERDICVRAGLHCSPAAHRSMGTLETGTVRVSFSAFNTRSEVERFLLALEREMRSV